MSDRDDPDRQRPPRAGGSGGDEGARPWVRGQGKRLSVRGGDSRASESPSARRSSLPRRASEKRFEAGSGSAWAHYMERARQAVSGSEVPAVDFDTVEVEIEESEVSRGRFERLSEPPPEWESRAEAPFAGRPARRPVPLPSEAPDPHEEEASSAWATPRRPAPLPSEALDPHEEEASSAWATPRRPEPSREARDRLYLSIPAPEPDARTPAPPTRSAPPSAAESAGPYASVDYPDWFVTNGLALLLSGDAERAQRYYTSCTRKAPDHPEGWYGLAAVNLRRGRTAEAADAFLRGWTIADGFPVGTFLRDACADDVEAWYLFAGALVAMRRRLAYQCADLALLEVIGDPGSSSPLRQRAARVRRSIAVALEARAAHDRRRGGPLGALPRALLHSVVILAVLGALAAVGLWAMRGGRLTSPATGSKAVSPSSGASPARAIETAQTAAAEAPRSADEAPASSSGQRGPSPSSPGASERDTPDAPAAAPVEDATASDAPLPGEPPASSPSEAIIEVSDDHGNGHTVKLDGEVAGVTPLTLMVRPGVPCTITVLPRAGKRPWQVRLTPVGGKTKRLEAELPGS